MSQRCNRDAAVAIVEKIRGDILTGKFPANRYLPTTRELASDYGASPETVRRGLKRLEGEGLLVSIPRHGFRVVRRAEDGTATGPVAYITEYGEDWAGAQPANWAILDALHHAAAARGHAVLSTPCGGRDIESVIERLRAGRASGIVLDTLNPLLVEAIRRSGLPLVMVNSWIEDSDLDVVLQDNYRGGFLAARFLLAAGCRRVAWLGPKGRFCHTRERFGGAVAALAAEGLRIVEPPAEDGAYDAAFASAMNLMKAPDRPDGILAFTSACMAAVRDAAARLGLRLGTDVKAVGWIVEEFYSREHASLFGEGDAPPAVVWKASSMAEQALDLLSRRREGRGGEPVRVCVPTRLRFAGK